MQLIGKGTAIKNHSFLRFLDVSTGGNALLCMSNNPECCTEDNANWFVPGSTTPLTTSSSPYSVSRSTTAPGNVALIRNSLSGADRDDNDGLYRCEIIDIDGSTQMLFVWLDAASQGKLLLILCVQCLWDPAESHLMCLCPKLSGGSSMQFLTTS